MSMTMEQVVIQLQQELFTLRAQVAAESGLADPVRTVQVRKDTPSLIDVKRPVVEQDGGILRWCDQGV